jgi:hypothetical protein
MSFFFNWLASSFMSFFSPTNLLIINTLRELPNPSVNRLQLNNLTVLTHSSSSKIFPVVLKSLNMLKVNDVVFDCNLKY